jgi:hypothetical protein
MELNASIDTSQLENKLRIFSSGLGNIFNELLNEVGKEMTAEAKSNASGAFNNRTGNLQKSIKFLFDKKNNLGALTTRKNLHKSNVWYSNIVEHGANINIKNKDYLMFKIDGEWKKVKSVNVRPRPFMKPVWEDYFGSNSSKGYTALAAALEKKMNEELE